ncbi:TPA: hypothetical protein KET99_000161 [Proteus mirabilis]|nr:hypothetical protein [Proteus mirabilis]
MIKLLRKGLDVPTEYFNWTGVNGGRLLLGRTLLAIHGKKNSANISNIPIIN